ncbi:TRM11 family SAM-dependent methyltransferase [Brachybacterium endophyticum]|uniref:TRM11 family SAM-dependent methyltransferase n=1 Tax=Brachybacterium endophyticum TaxID=2182385 RepID=UPI00196B0CC6|nr:hypothetical protein [Brachybacterium endophyticum]
MSAELLLLRSPSANRVFTAAAGPLSVREAQWVLGSHAGAPADVHEHSVAGVDYLRILAEDTDLVRSLLAMLSAPFALFAPHPSADDGGETLLRPVALPQAMRHGSELETTLRYPGKTNEQFTAMLLNLAAALSSRRAGLLRGDLAVLDPTCGRGTTLNRALRLGLSPTGADLDRKDIDAYRTFLAAWAKQHRLPHTQSSGGLPTTGTGRGAKSAGSRWELDLAADRTAQRAGDVQKVRLLTCDTADLGAVLPYRSVDALVADLPYGVQHGARTEGWQRSPLELLERAVPAWRALLRTGGGIALALNRRTAPYTRVREILEAHDLHVLSADGEFRHRVDQSIDRDVVLAVPRDHPQLAMLRTLTVTATAEDEAGDAEHAPHVTHQPARAPEHGPRERTPHE